MIEEIIKEKLERFKKSGDPDIIVDLALLNASVGNYEVSQLYINEYKKISKESTDIIQLPNHILQQILDIKYHNKWRNYRRERNQNEKKKFAVTASLCEGDVFEIGCANGDLSSYISMYGNRVYGIDLDPIAIELARYKMWSLGLSNCFFNIGDANDLLLPDSLFDTVVLAEILEHVPNPENVIFEAKRVCKKNGKIIISVPRGYRIPSPDHLHVFNEDKIVKLIESTGVKEKDIYWDSNIPNEWLLCWFYNRKEDNKIENNIPIEEYFIPSHPLESLSNAGMVSVILPTFNGEAYIGEAIDSILKQTYQNIELIVINDGSTDETYKKLKPYIDNGYIKYIYQENSGKPAAINKGIEMSKGDYIWIFDDDDTAFPRKLEVHMRQFLRKPEVDLLHTSAVYTDSKNSIPLLVWEPLKIEQRNLLRSKLHGCLFHGVSVVARKECYLKAGMWDERLIRAQDYDMWIRLSRICNIDQISMPTVTYRQHKKVRGSKDNPIPVEKIATATKEYEMVIMEKVYNNIPLEEIFPEIKERPDNPGMRVSALIERAYAMARRELFNFALKDLKEAFDLALLNYPVNLTDYGIYYIDKFSKEITVMKDENLKKIIRYFTVLIASENSPHYVKKTKNIPTLSLCIITKDEEKNISRCINSVKDIVDEIVVVDTGSKDRTAEIAESLGARVIHEKWQDDFSKARNTAIEHAKSDWILFLDADEEVKKEDVAKILPLLNDDTVEAYIFKFVNYGGSNVSDDFAQIHYNFKLFRNDGKLKYVYPIHENLKNVADDSEPIFKKADVTILHYGYLSEIRIEKNKTQRYIKMLSDYLLEHPNDMFQHVNLGVEYFNAGEYRKAIKHLMIAYKSLPANSSLMIRALIYLIYAHTELKEYEQALNIIKYAAARYPQVPDFRFLEGNIYIEQKRYQKAVEMFTECLSIGEYKGIANIIAGTGSYKARYMIAFCYEKLGQLHNAVQEYTKLLIAKPGYGQVFRKLFEIFVKNEKPETVREFFDKYVEKTNPANFAILAQLYLDIGEFDTALQYLEEINIDIGGLNNLKGIAYMGLKKYDDALKCFEAEFGKSRNMSVYYTSLCYIILKNLDRAKDILWELEDSADKKLFLSLIGDMRAKFDDIRESFFQLLSFLLKINEFELFNNALNIYNIDFGRDDYARYGKMMQDYGFEEPAVQSYIIAAERNCQNAEVYRYLAQKAIEKGMNDDALVMASNALNLDKTDIDNYMLIYRLYTIMNKNDEAELIDKIVKEMYPEINLEELAAIAHKGF